MDVGGGYRRRISPHDVVRRRSPTKAPEDWTDVGLYPVLAERVNATDIGSLRRAWFKWIRITERKKQAIRNATQIAVDKWKEKLKISEYEPKTE